VELTLFFEASEEASIEYSMKPAVRAKQLSSEALPQLRASVVNFTETVFNVILEKEVLFKGSVTVTINE